MNTGLDGLARLAWAQLWQVTAVALAVGALVRCCCRDRPRLAYALWMLVVVKSVVPPVWSSPMGLFSWALAGGAEARTSVIGGPPGDAPDLSPIAPVGGDPSRAADAIEGQTVRAREMDRAHLHVALFAAWSAGLVLCAGFVLGKQIACAKLIRRSSLPVDERLLSTLADLSRRLGVRRGVRLVVTSRPIGPAVFGQLRPTILLPGPLVSGASPEQVELILAHELVHVRRGDVFAGMLQLVAQLIWWFHPLVWWANRGAGRERERCCDEEVVSGVGCRPALYARALLHVLEQKERLRSLVALPGVRALEVTSLRLESIMRYARTDHRRASRISRVVFAAGLAVLIPGTGLTTRARSLADDDADVVVATATPKTATQTLRGVVREKGTGRPVAGAKVYVTANFDDDGRSSSSAVTDDDGRYTIADLPESREYALIVSPEPGAPYLITSRRVEATEDKGPVTADVEFVRGIPFRVRVLDRETGRPLKGSLVYYPVSPNNPFERGVMGYVGRAAKGSFVCGAFYEAGPDEQGQFRGAVLPGPGFLGFSHPYRPGDESRADRKPVVSFPDGKENVKLIPNDRGGPFGFVPIGSDPLIWTGLPLGQFDAVIAIAPREGTEEVTYEIRIPPDKASE
jgi:beta-lactamase regulating signal transducer with metallopeptidase domain